MERFDFNAANGCLTINGELTVYEAEPARLYFLQHCTGGALRTVDLSGVTEIDCAGLQLLLNVVRLPEPARLVSASAEVSALFSLLQMDHLLDESGGLTA